MSVPTSPAAASAAAIPAPPARTSPAVRETRQATALILGALGVGGLLQVFVEPGPWALVSGALGAGLFVLVLSRVVPGRWRETLAGFRFTAALLFVLSGTAVLGTLILQNKPLAFYEARYGLLGQLIVGLRLDDIFHSLWFAGFVALFVAGVITSAVLRWPIGLRNAGFFTAHLGLLCSLGGAGASAALSVKGRVDLHAGGETATKVLVTRAGVPTGTSAPLGFDLRLDRFDLVRYGTEFRIAYYDLTGPEPRLQASFDPEVGVRHLLPAGDAFRIVSLRPDVLRETPPGAPLTDPGAVLEVSIDGRPRPTGLMLASRQDHVRTRRGALVFERRDEEVKAFSSHVTALDGGRARQAVINVNDPFSFGGWTFYQVNFDPKDPSYSGLEAVRDPGVAWVFLGFALISLGVFSMFYLEPRLKRAAAARA